MKKLFTYMLTAIVAASSFTSCDKDEKESMRLQGEWEGDFFACYSYYYKAETKPRTAYADLTYMSFTPDHLFGSTRGTGYEVDIYNSGPIAYMKYEFDWRVDEGHIYLTYWDAPEMNITINDYRLSYARFQGHFGEGNYTIDLRKVDSWDGSIYVSPMELRADEFAQNYSRFSGCRNYVRARQDKAEVIDPEDIEIVSQGRAKR